MIQAGNCRPTLINNSGDSKAYQKKAVELFGEFVMEVEK